MLSMESIIHIDLKILLKHYYDDALQFSKGMCGLLVYVVTQISIC